MMIFGLKITSALFIVIFIVMLHPNESYAQTTITFDGGGLVEGELVTNQFSGVTFTGAIFGTPGFPQVGWNAKGGTQADIIFAPDLGFNGPFITDEIIDGSFSVAGTILIDFEKVANGVSFLLGDIDSGETFVISGFGSAGSMLGTFEVSAGQPETGDGVATLVEIPWVGVRSLEIFGMQANNFVGFGIDFLTFSNGLLLGDINCDGQVNLLDVAPFVNVLVNGGFDSKADINQDGVVDLLDVAPFVDLLTGG